MKKQDLTSYGSSELSMHVMNDEYLYNHRFDEDLKVQLEEQFIFTDEQLEELEEDLQEELDQEEEEKLETITDLKETFKIGDETQEKSCLINDVINYFVDYYTTYDEVVQGMKGCINHGCVSGCIGRLTYYTDTNKFFDDYEEEISDLVYDMAQNMGLSWLEFIASLNGGKDVGSMEQLKNLLAWFAFEETTRKILEEINEY